MHLTRLSAAPDLGVFDFDLTLTRWDTVAAGGYAAPWAITCTDRACDLPVIKLARERFLVNPKPGAAESIERDLGCRSEVLAWS